MWADAENRDEARIDEAFKKHDCAVQLQYVNENRICIYVSRSPKNGFYDFRYAFYIEYKKDVETGKKFRRIFEVLKNGDKEVWRAELDGSTDLEQLARKQYHKILQLYRIHLNNFDKNGCPFKCEQPLNSDIENLKNLESLDIECDVEDIVSEHAEGWLDDHIIIYGRHVNSKLPVETKTSEEIGDFFYSPFCELTNDVFLKIKAPCALIHIGPLTPQNIFDFLQSWRAGEIREDFEWLIWNIRDSEFDTNELWRLLNSESEHIVIRQTRDHGKIGRLYTSGGELRFFTEEQEEPSGKMENVEKPKSTFFVNLLNCVRKIFKSPLAEKRRHLQHI